MPSTVSTARRRPELVVKFAAALPFGGSIWNAAPSVGLEALHAEVLDDREATAHVPHIVSTMKISDAARDPVRKPTIPSTLAWGVRRH